MHLLASRRVTVTMGDDFSPVECDQKPGEVVFLSCADSELSMLARAHDLLGGDAPSLRMANIAGLSHNFSVDSYMDRIVVHARLVVVRLLGGYGYWPYGFDSIVAHCREKGIGLAIIPGGDAGLSDGDVTTCAWVRIEDAVRAWEYLSEGGMDNSRFFLKFCQFLLKEGENPPPVHRLGRVGLYDVDSGGACRDDGAILAQALCARGKGIPRVFLVFYSALMESGNLEPIESLVAALRERGLYPVAAYVNSLKDMETGPRVEGWIESLAPSVILNMTGFSVSGGTEGNGDVLGVFGCPVLQVVLSRGKQETWLGDERGLNMKDLAMNIVLPELDGRIATRAISFKSDPKRHGGTDSDIVIYESVADRVGFVSDQAARWARLGKKRASERRIAIVLANYPNRDGRIGNGVGYDTPASTLAILKRMAESGYHIGTLPLTSDELMDDLLRGSTNGQGCVVRASSVTLGAEEYQEAFSRLPGRVREEICAQWGEVEEDPFFSLGAFYIPVVRYGHAVLGIQPARGYNIDPTATYHDPALVPPHGYLAFYVWLREIFGVDAVIHNGKHGNLEWLPGKATALSSTCYPEVMLGAVPHLYPFIVNDPGEGTQAKRRASAVIIDHLVPPLARAESYGVLRDLEVLLDEYHEAETLDPRRAAFLRRKILDLRDATGLDHDVGSRGGESAALADLDAYVCELKEAQIRNGLHILGSVPEGRAETETLAALVRVPRHLGIGKDGSLQRAIAMDLGLDFDPLDCDMSRNWKGPKPQVLQDLISDKWRTCGDTVERVEEYAIGLLEGRFECPGVATQCIVEEVEQRIRKDLRACGHQELAHLMAGLSGGRVPPGPSGAPTRGRLEVLPTGRNFFSLDNRGVPTPAAWELGMRSAEMLLDRHFQEHGVYPRAIGLSAWGTSNMRTGGDDIAQAMALLGVRPLWDQGSWRLSGFEVIPLVSLGRPRVDVTLRVSGFFRDAFPVQMDVFAAAVHEVSGLEEAPGDNPLAMHVRDDCLRLVGEGKDLREAKELASYRVFGSRPGTYGAGLQALIDEGVWDDVGVLAETYLDWGAHAYGAGAMGTRAEESFRQRLSDIEVVIQNQDNREHDLLDSDDYYQFEGGMTVGVTHVSGRKPVVYHNDHSRPERLRIRTLEEEAGRVVRSRVVNPKWIEGVMRHGYKGCSEIAATVDYMFAFAATTGAIRDHHFDLAYKAFIEDERVREFIREHNGPALMELSGRFLEAMERSLWHPKSNYARHVLVRCRSGENIEE